MWPFKRKRTDADLAAERVRDLVHSVSGLTRFVSLHAAMSTRTNATADNILRNTEKIAMDLSKLAVAVQHIQDEDAAIRALVASQAAQLREIASKARDGDDLQDKVLAFADTLEKTASQQAAIVLANTGAANPLNPPPGTAPSPPAPPSQSGPAVDTGMTAPPSPQTAPGASPFNAAVASDIMVTNFAADASTPGQVTLNWTTVDNNGDAARKLQAVEIWTATSLDQAPVYVGDALSSSYVINSPPAGSWWRARARDASRNVGQWSGAAGDVPGQSNATASANLQQGPSGTTGSLGA